MELLDIIKMRLKHAEEMVAVYGMRSHIGMEADGRRQAFEEVQNMIETKWHEEI